MYFPVEFSQDNEVIGPERTAANVCTVIRSMREASPAPGNGDLLVMARVFHMLFTEQPETLWWPMLLRHEDDRSLLMVVLRFAEYADLVSFERAEEAEDYLAASNIARWVMGVRQQPHPLLVVCDPPPDPEEIPHQCSDGRWELAAG